MPTRILVFLTIVASALPAAKAHAQAGGKCGEERWPVKVLQDADARTVDLAARPTSIAALTGLPRPLEARGDDRRLAIERRTFRIRARLMESIPQADGDLHLVLADLTDPARTMVAEIPDSTCAPRSRHASDFAEAQRWVTSIGLPIDVEVEGVAFWDDFHGQRGMAPNGIELHPVLRIMPLLTRSDLLMEEVGAAPPDTTEVRVWVNTASRVYHCPGSANYGTTRDGTYMPEAAARRAGARPAGGRACR